MTTFKSRAILNELVSLSDAIMKRSSLSLDPYEKVVIWLQDVAKSTNTSVHGISKNKALLAEKGAFFLPAELDSSAESLKFKTRTVDSSDNKEEVFAACLGDGSCGDSEEGSDAY